MIIVSGTVQVKADKIAEVKHALQVMVSATRKEEGCIHYQFYQDIDDPTIFLFYEEWSSEETLAAHAKSPHMGVLQSQIPEFVVAPPKAKRFEATELS